MRHRRGEQSGEAGNGEEQKWSRGARQKWSIIVGAEW